MGKGKKAVTTLWGAITSLGAGAASVAVTVVGTIVNFVGFAGQVFTMALEDFVVGVLAPAIEKLIWMVGDLSQYVWGVIGPAWASVAAIAHWIQDLYTTYIGPTLAWIHSQIAWLVEWIDRVERAARQLLDELRLGVFGEIFELWRRIEDITDRVARLIGIFDKELAQKILEVRTEIYDFTLGRIDRALAQADAWVRDLADEVRGPLRRLEASWDDFTSIWRPAIVEIGEIVDLTIEEPQLLRKKTIQATGAKYGTDLWEAWAGTLAEPIPADVQARYEAPIVNEKIQELADAIVDALEDPWDKISKAADEMIDELFGRETPEVMR